MRCCDAWLLIGKCFEPISFECIDIKKLSQILANLTRESLAERETEISNLPWTQTEKHSALARCRFGQRAWRPNIPYTVTDEDGHHLEAEDESRRRLCEYWGSIFQVRVEGPRHQQSEDILRYVQKAPGDIRWTIDRSEFDDLIASKKDSAPGPDGIPYGVFISVREGWVASSFSKPTSTWWKVVLFLNTLRKVGRSLFPRPLTPMTMGELFGLQMRFDH